MNVPRDQEERSGANKMHQQFSKNDCFTKCAQQQQQQQQQQQLQNNRFQVLQRHFIYIKSIIITKVFALNRCFKRFFYRSLSIKVNYSPKRIYKVSN